MRRSRLDLWTEEIARQFARGTSRRTFLARFGAALAGAATVPLLPVLRASADEGKPGDPGDPKSCDYWRYCAIDGFLCSCCGGSVSSCPPGSAMSPVTWIGTCRNPADGVDYVISYNDCCGKGFCGRCACNRNEGDKPIYVQPKSNDINWCSGMDSIAYHCSTAIIVGTSKPA